MVPERSARSDSVLDRLQRLFRNSVKSLSYAIVGAGLRAMSPGLRQRACDRLAYRRENTPFPGWAWEASDDPQRTRLILRRMIWESARRLSQTFQIQVHWINDLSIEVNLGDDLSWCLFVTGAYEPNEFAFLGTVLRDGMCFVDVGANHGLYSVFAASQVGPAGSVIALEPSHRELERLRANVDRNQLAGVEVFEIAAHSVSGTARLRIAEREHPGHNTLGEFAYAIEESHLETVRTEPLDAVLKNRRVDFIKIDVEGAEMSVLEGALGSIERCRPMLLVEVVDAALQGQGRSSKDVLGQLQQLGYELWRFGHTGRPEPLDPGSVASENVLAVHRSRDDLSLAGPSTTSTA
jgi:FkbM family methyltransferase